MAAEASSTPVSTPAADNPLASRITPAEKEDKLEEPAVPTAPAAPIEAASGQIDGAPATLGGSGLEEPEYDVAVQFGGALAGLQADPSNPLYSVKSFQELGLSPEILKGILNMNFNKPSKIQEKALPILLHNPPSNLIGQSQSGTGKTAAFTLNILSRIDISNLNPQALVLAPSRELARQIVGVVTTMGQFVQGLQVQVAVPDPSKRGQKLQGQIVVGTPGTVMDMIKRRTLEAKDIKILVLDEADNMLNQQGLGDQCHRVKTLLPRGIQVVLFSATFPDQVLKYADRFCPDASKITLQHEELTVEGIKQFFFDCENEEHKYQTLVRFYGLLTIASSIIFVERRDTAAEIERRMTEDGHKVAQLSGALEGVDRDKVIDRFRKGEAKVLIATNVIARGIDVQTVTMVINYDIPKLQRGEPDFETYLHRIGRTGRFGRVGVAVSFICDERSWSQLAQIKDHFNTDIQPLDPNDWDAVEETVKKVIKDGRAGAKVARQDGNFMA